MSSSGSERGLRTYIIRVQTDSNNINVEEILKKCDLCDHIANNKRELKLIQP